MMEQDKQLLSDDEERTVDDSRAAYRPEGNEAGVLSEYTFELRWESLCEGLVFPEEEEATYVPEHHPHAP